MFASDFSLRRPDRTYARPVWLIVGLAIVSGCATTRDTVDLPDLGSWAERESVLGGAKHWSFKGRIAVKAGDEGFNGSINWTQSGDGFFATVGGPLGIGTVRIDGDGRTIVLTDKEGVQTRLHDAESELFARYGWTIPVASLRYWALGIPDPSMPAETSLDDLSRLRELRQRNWIVDFSRYRKGAGQDLPRTITANNPDTRVRMVIDKWMFFDR